MEVYGTDLTGGHAATTIVGDELSHTSRKL